MSSRVTLHHTPAGILGLSLPLAAIAVMGVVAFAQRTPGLSPLSESEVAASKVVSSDPFMDPMTEPTLCHPEAAVDPSELHLHKVAHARALALQLEHRAAAAPDGTTSISMSDLRMLRSAMAYAPSMNTTRSTIGAF